MKLRLSHRLRAWFLNRQASNLLRRVNRQHQQSTHMIGGNPDSGLTVTGLAMGIIGLCLLVLVNVIDKA